MQRMQAGFTPIELMIVVAIVGILAAVALPAYQDYVIRSKVLEAIAALAACKTSVTEYFATTKMIPTDTDQAGCSTIGSQYVSTLTVAPITVSPSNFQVRIVATATNTGIGDCDLRFTSNVEGWSGSTTCDAKCVPANFR